MPQTMLLRLPANLQDETEWLVLDETGVPTLTRQRGALSLAAAVWRTGRLIALAPATQMLLAEPELPPGAGAKLARAVPFALEEQLTEDIDDLSFALGRRTASGLTPVAVVSKAVLEGWINALRNAGLDPQAIYPDMSLVPENPGVTVLWLEGSRLTVRRPGALPFSVELSPFKEALVVAGVIADPLAIRTAEQLLEPKLPEDALLYITREDWEGVKEELEDLMEHFASLKVQLLPDGPLPWLARSLIGTDAVNLLQGDYARAADYGVHWKQWRVPAALAALLLVVHVGAQALQIRQAKRDASALDTEIAQLFNSTVTGEPLRDARRQMQARLERARHGGASPEYFLRSLKATGDAVRGIPKAKIDALSFREHALDMKVTAPDLSAVSQITQTLGQQGMAADIQSSTPIPGGVEAHLQVHTEGATK